MYKEIIEYIDKHIEEFDYAPTQADIARALGIHRATVRYHFHNLKDKVGHYPEYRRYFK